MKLIFTIILMAVAFVTAEGRKYSYNFSNIPVSEALVRIGKDHPNLNLAFIYKELDHYKTSGRIYTDDDYEALRQTVGLNPVSVVKKDGVFYIEALQRGKFCYTGRAIGTDHEPVAAATVMLLVPKDSTVITYGITDDAGYFSILCDRQGVIAKLTCLGYRPTFRKCDNFSVGTIVMAELPVKLKNVNVEADAAALYSDKSVYRPTQRQKNASQTATDLLGRMAIPQLNVRLGSADVLTAAGQPVAMYIDYVPATADELRMMKMSDVRSVEYLTYPSDSRFQGNKYVINFRMVKYEYGGYVKALATENFIANSGLLQANTRLVNKRMTYDVMGYGYYMNNNHFGTDRTETFRFPQANGNPLSFQRNSSAIASKFSKQNFETSLRALYSSDRITANSQISFGLDNTPYNASWGIVSYSQDLFKKGSYASLSYSNAKYLNYNGYYYFTLSPRNSLTASAGYLFSHTDQESEYTESDFNPIVNGADDDTHRGNLQLDYNHRFTDRHSFRAFVRGLYEHNHTDYSGSVNAIDISVTKFGQLGASYSFTNSSFSGYFGIGWNWLMTKLNENKADSDYPYLDVSFSYVLNHKNSFGGIFHYSVWPPSANYKSENVIQILPFLWHTGNPLLKSHRSYDIGVNYTFIPSGKFSMTFFANTWLVGNRAAFVYTPSSDGIIRTIQQPIGQFGHYNYGINASITQFEGRLQLYAQLAQLYVHNGQPYNINRSCISYYVQTLYYAGQFNFAVVYESPKATENYDSMSGIWSKVKGNFILQAGWSNQIWNIRLTAQNIQRWSWCASYDTMRSEYYSTDTHISNASRHALIQLSATYTFGFGKKVSQDNDISRQSGASSGILK
ncbi:MAG: outer membrane beta-barrel family protein [Muribaculaceae bacterium]|nr:outer membrane beta-barrel family protein [Muribaculaceae bacterium]